jgi:ketosteroid isomerase-like protein
MKLREILVLALLGGCAGCNSVPATDTTAKDQADIRALEDRFITAFKAKDVNAIMACYVPDQSLIVFDVSPPRQYTGAPAYKKDFEDLFAAFPGPADGTTTDLDITVGGDVGYGRSVQHVTLTGKDGKKMELTVRVTDGYKKINGQWLIAHEHVSVPVDLATLKPDLDSK